VDNRFGYTNMDIYAQRINSSGVPLWTSGGVPATSAPLNQLNVEISADGLGGLFLVWQDNREGSSNPDIYAQKIDSLGNILWGDDGRAVSVAILPQTFPDLSTDGFGNLIVAWEDRRADVHWDIYAQRIREDGSLGGPIVPGDVNGDGLVNPTDLVFLAYYLFAGGPPPEPLLRGDVNGDCQINSMDLAYLANYLFGGGPPPSSC
jgi:hypothetical protein